MIIHDRINQPPAEAVTRCPVCGLSWTTRTETRACCMPGEDAHRRGDRGGVEIPGLPARAHGGVAYIEDRAALVLAINEAKGDQTWRDFTNEHKLYPSIFQNIINGTITWVKGGVYAELVKLFGEDVPGLFYWPLEASAPVGVESLEELA